MHFSWLLNMKIRIQLKVFLWLEKAASQGHAGAQYALGVCSYFGQGIEQDGKKAQEWYDKAAIQG